MIAYDKQGRIWFNLFFVCIIIMVTAGLIIIEDCLINRARAKKERQARRERTLCNAVVALNRHAVVVDKAIKKLKRRGAK